jgi:VWFA-related protein
MRNQPTAILFTLTLVTLLALPAVAQDEPQAEFRGELEVTEVLLDVLVTDGSGNAIMGLQPEDFIVEDEGEKIDVTSATFYSNRRFLDSGSAAERLGVAPEEVPVDRYFILFFHDQRLSDPTLTTDQLDAIRWVRQWVDYELLPSDWVAVLSYDVKLKVHQDFTTNKEALQNALTSVAKAKDPGANWPSRQELDAVRGPSLRKNLPQGKDLNKQSRRQIYSGLRLAGEAAGYITGRKNLMLFSIGFGELNDMGTYNPDQRYFPPMVEALNDNNVAVYSISWVKNLAQETPEMNDLGNALSLLSADTGGTYYFNFANFNDPLREVVDDNSGYYLLSYSSERPAGETGYSRVEVKTSNPSFVVRARQGYRYGG